MYGEEILAEMLGKTLVSVDGLENGSESVTFTAETGEAWRMYHQQDCCESVSIADFSDDPSDLIGSPILMAELVSNEGATAPEFADSYTWTFVKFATVRGYVTVRWLGKSNGYYSEAPYFERLKGGR